MYRYSILLVVVVVCSAGFLGNIERAAQRTERPEFEKYFQHYGVTGACVVYNAAEDTYVYYNAPKCREQLLPASTFKIPNSLIALETGVVPDEHTLVAWDSVERFVPAWNADTDLRHAFANSTVWYYQEIARRIGKKRMQEYIKKFHYGNKNISGGIDKFWLTGGLRISPEEQVQFLRHLHSGMLPVSQRTLGIVKDIFIREKTEEYTLSGKTGWGMVDSTDIGWFVGWVEREGNTWFYAVAIQSTNANKQFPEARIAIAKSILRELQAIP